MRRVELDAVPEEVAAVSADARVAALPRVDEEPGRLRIVPWRVSVAREV